MNEQVNICDHDADVEMQMIEKITVNCYKMIENKVVRLPL